MSCPVPFLVLLGVVLQLWKCGSFTTSASLAASSFQQAFRWNLPAPESLHRKQAARRRCVTRSHDPSC